KDRLQHQYFILPGEARRPSRDALHGYGRQPQQCPARADLAEPRGRPQQQRQEPANQQREVSVERGSAQEDEDTERRPAKHQRTGLDDASGGWPPPRAEGSGSGQEGRNEDDGRSGIRQEAQAPSLPIVIAGPLRQNGDRNIRKGESNRRSEDSAHDEDDRLR